ncbi:uncharacterized protein LOC144295722 [Canis aureus]
MVSLITNAEGRGSSELNWPNDWTVKSPNEPVMGLMTYKPTFHVPYSSQRSMLQEVEEACESSVTVLLWLHSFRIVSSWKMRCDTVCDGKLRARFPNKANCKE